MFLFYSCICRANLPLGFPGGSVVKTLPATVGDVGSIPGWEDPQRRKWQPTPVFLPGKSHVQRSLVGYGPWGCKESDKTANSQQQQKSALTTSEN